MNLDEIKRILGLSGREARDFESNYFEVEDEIMELIDLYSKYAEMIERRNQLHTQLARYNFNIHETWMELHKNAISLSSYRAEVNLREIGLESNFSKRMNEIIDSYLLIENFA